MNRTVQVFPTGDPQLLNGAVVSRTKPAEVSEEVAETLLARGGWEIAPASSTDDFTAQAPETARSED